MYKDNYPLHEQIPSIIQTYGIQTDGTIVGTKDYPTGAMTEIGGCFNNDGTNFRPFENQYGYRIGQMNSGFIFNVAYDKTNWIPVSDGQSNHYYYWKVIAANDGKGPNGKGTCQLDPINSFYADATLNLQASWGSITQPQITKNGVFALVEINGKRVLRFYKYPPAQN